MINDNNPHDPSWVSNLLHLMNGQGFSARGLSLRAGLNATAVRDIIEGRSRFPRYSTIQALSSVLNTTPSVLMGEASAKIEVAKQMYTFAKHIEHLSEIAACLDKTLQEVESKLASNNSAEDRGSHNKLGTKDIILTSRQKEIMTWAIIGKTNGEIGEILKISKHTVNVHFRRIYEKTEVNNRVQAVAKVLALGIVNL